MSAYSNKNTNPHTLILLLVIVSITSIAFETITAKFYNFLFPGPASLQLNLGIFFMGILIFPIVQWFVLRTIRNQTNKLFLNQQRKLKLLFKFVILIQFVLTAFLSLTLWQAIGYLYYSTYLVIGTISISYALAIVNLSLLSRLFLGWLRNNRSYVSILFGVSTIAILISSILTVVYAISILIAQPNQIKYHLGQMFQTISNSTYTLQSIYSLSLLMSYVLTWLATVAVLRNYSTRLGKRKFWLLASLPLLYVLGQFQPLFLPFFYGYLIFDPYGFTITYTLFFSVVKLTGAIFFGIGFWVMSRRIRQESLRSFMSLCSYGLILFFVSNQAVLLLNNLFPPIGLSAICFVGLSSFLLLTGIYSAAVSVANDIEIRKSIRKSVKKEFELIKNIGEAEMDTVLRNKVLSVTNALSTKLIEGTGIESSFTFEDIKVYTNQALEEIKRAKSSK